MRTYYAFDAHVRYYGEVPERVWIENDSKDGFGPQIHASRKARLADVRKWKEPPHLFLANLPVNPSTGIADLKALEKFTRTYGLLRSVDDPFIHSKDWIVDPTISFAQRDRLRQAWQGKPEWLASLRAETGDLDFRVAANFHFDRDGIELRVRDLWHLILLLFQYDYTTGRARVCAIKDCPRTPFFLQARKGQQFCSHECAILETVRRLRARGKGRKRGGRKGK